MRLLTIETESRSGTLWDQGRKRMRGRQYRKSSIKKDSGGEDRMDTATKEFLAIEFKRTQDARSNYVERQQLLDFGVGYFPIT